MELKLKFSVQLIYKMRSRCRIGDFFNVKHCIIFDSHEKLIEKLLDVDESMAESS